MRRRYGAGPLHLLGHVALFALAAYAVTQLFTLGAVGNALVWLVGAVLVHDAVLWPLYSSADRAGRLLLRGAINHVRVPLGLSLLLGLVFAGTVTGKGANAYRNASGQTYDGYLTRWLAVSAALFALSAVVYVVRRGKA
jgi:hypothetical protein